MLGLPGNGNPPPPADHMLQCPESYNANAFYAALVGQVLAPAFLANIRVLRNETRRCVNTVLKRPNHHAEGLGRIKVGHHETGRNPRLENPGKRYRRRTNRTNRPNTRRRSRLVRTNLRHQPRRTHPRFIIGLGFRIRMLRIHLCLAELDVGNRRLPVLLKCNSDSTTGCGRQRKNQPPREHPHVQINHHLSRIIPRAVPASISPN